MYNRQFWYQKHKSRRRTPRGNLERRPRRLRCGGRYASPARNEWDRWLASKQKKSRQEYPVIGTRLQTYGGMRRPCCWSKAFTDKIIKGICFHQILNSKQAEWWKLFWEAKRNSAFFTLPGRRETHANVHNTHNIHICTGSGWSLLIWL